MGKNYLLIQEIEVWYIIPRLRKEFAKEFLKKGMSYEEIGKILGISKVAVSYYLRNKRGNKIKLSNEIKEEIKKSVNLIINKESNIVNEIQRILKKMRETKCSCNICREYNKKILEYCNCELI